MIDLHRARIVRLNAELFPIREAEAEFYNVYGLTVKPVEVALPEEIIAHVKDADAIVVVSGTLPEAVINSLEHCRIIARLGAGTDKIAVRVASIKGIIVANVPDFCAEEQADHAMALLLGLTRQIPQMQLDMAQGAWTRARANVHFRRLESLTLGLVGFGYSAVAMARRAKAFGMEILATRRNLNAPSVEAEALDVEMVTMAELLRRADVVSLHLPLEKNTYHLFGEDMFRQMKRGSLFINTARGALTDEDALVRVLQEGWLGGAGIDTFEQINVHAEEQAPPQHPLLNLSNVILTPHVAAFSPTAMYNVAMGTVENVVAVLSGYLPPTNRIVNPDAIPQTTLAAPNEAIFQRGKYRPLASYL